MNKEITVNLLLDGFRYDYIRHASFLKSLSKEAFVARTQEPFGFESVRPAIFAGVYPENSDISHIFLYSPETSRLGIFKWLQEVRFLQKKRVLNKYSNLLFDIVFKILLKLILRTPMAVGASDEDNVIKKIISYMDPRAGNANLYEIPSELLSYFGFGEKKLCYMERYIKGYPTIFDILRIKNKRWTYYGYPTSSLVNVYNNSLIRNLKKIDKKIDFTHIHVYNTDEVGHKYGPDSEEIKVIIEKIDGFIEELYNSLTSRYDIINLIIHGDHGMVPITNTVDIWSLLKNSNLKIGKDYVVFLDSTMVRFWFKSKNAENKIREILSQLDCGRILREDDYKKHRIRFKHNKYGDLIWLANPGTLIFPNFFQWTEPAKGMHGYNPECIENQGLFMLITNKNVEIKKKEVVPLVDIFPTTLDLMNLPIPKTCEGESLIEGDKNG